MHYLRLPHLLIVIVVVYVVAIVAAEAANAGAEILGDACDWRAAGFVGRLYWWFHQVRW